MDGLLAYILASTFVVSLLGLSGIFSLRMRDAQLKKITFVLVPLAGGALIGGAFLHLLPEAVEQLEPETAFLIAICGFFLFLIMETYFHWHACRECSIHPYTYVMLVGDAIHNFIDGLVIAAAYIVSIPLGVITTVLIFSHEFPQQLGLFGVLLHGGFDKRKSVLYSYLVQLTVIAGGVVGYLLTGAQGFAAMLMPFAAGGFIYMAAADIVPEMHKSEGKDKVYSIAIFLMGVLFMLGVKLVGGE